MRKSILTAQLFGCAGFFRNIIEMLVSDSVSI